MKHVHYDKIVAKAANMDLVVFSYCNLDMKWSEDKPSQPGVEFIDSNNTDYFLCLPQHKEACLHWLNGGESQYLSNGMKEWINFGDSIGWSDTHLFMTNECELRIKPKKEKRLIVYRNGTVYGEFLSKNEINDDFIRTGQVIEIEVEV
ncbi:hypothetical protein NVP1216O_65 [Vibrio phage 1.216.O._10N.222.55.C12]|nr:hypothetical protein NVP1216O_65 [Vibrio phage 1.216.O._10N.222.55.C12]